MYSNLNVLEFRAYVGLGRVKTILIGRLNGNIDKIYLGPGLSDNSGMERVGWSGTISTQPSEAVEGAAVLREKSPVSVGDQSSTKMISGL